MQKLAVKTGKRVLKETDASSSDNDFDWLHTLRDGGARRPCRTAGPRGAGSEGESALTGEAARPCRTAGPRGAGSGGESALTGEAVRSKRTASDASTPAKKRAKASPSSVSSKASPRETGGQVVYKSVQVREINALNGVLAKYHPMVSSVATEEGVAALNADILHKSKLVLERKAAPATCERLRTRRETVDEVADEGNKVASMAEKLTQQLDAMEFLARGLSAKSSGEGGMFWLPSTIEDGIKRCVSADVRLPASMKRFCVHRQVDVALASDVPEERILDIVRVTREAGDEHDFGLWYLQGEATEVVAKVQRESVLRILKHYFSHKSGLGSLQKMLAPIACFDWVLDCDFRKVCENLSVVVLQRSADGEVVECLACVGGSLGGCWGLHLTISILCRQVRFRV